MQKTLQSLYFSSYIDQNLWECVKLADLVGLQTANELVLSFLNYSHYCRGLVFLRHRVEHEDTDQGQNKKHFHYPDNDYYCKFNSFNKKNTSFLTHIKHRFNASTRYTRVHTFP